MLGGLGVGICAVYAQWLLDAAAAAAAAAAAFV